jgi:hypothetical protein
MKLLLIPAIGLASLFGCTSESARIGDHDVPSSLRCEEDEVIGFAQTGTPPYELGCIHPDSLG